MRLLSKTKQNKKIILAPKLLNSILYVMTASTVNLACTSNANILMLLELFPRSFFLMGQKKKKKKRYNNPCSICVNIPIQEHTHWYQVFDTGTKKGNISYWDRRRLFSQMIAITHFNRLTPCTKPKIRLPTVTCFLTSFWLNILRKVLLFTTWKKYRDSKGVIERDGNRRRKAKKNGKQRIKVLVASHREAYQRANNIRNR